MIVKTATKIDTIKGEKGKGRGSNDEFHPCAIVQFYSAEFVCAADCLGSSNDRSNESELKRSIKNVNSPNWDVKWRITGGERQPASPRSSVSLTAFLLDCARGKIASRHFYGVERESKVGGKKQETVLQKLEMSEKCVRA